jgi:hypothetical protein
MVDIYRVVDSERGVVMGFDFPLKGLAKNLRNQLLKGFGKEIEGNKKPRYVVARGEDHFRGPTDGRDHTSRKKYY